jgi:hypothetical protein
MDPGWSDELDGEEGGTASLKAGTGEASFGRSGRCLHWRSR